MNKFQILLVGNYKVGNFGDDLLLKACLDNLKDQNVKILSTQNADFLTFPAGFRSLFEFQRYIQPFQAILRTKYILFGGGGLFNSDKLHSLLIWCPILLLGFVFQKPIYLFGHSFSSKPTKFLSFLLSKAQLITCRDNLSYNYLQTAGLRNIKLTNDLALELSFSPVKKTRPQYFMINYRLYKNIDFQKIQEINNLLLQKAQNLRLKPLYCAFDEHLDPVIFQKLNVDWITAHQLLDYLPQIQYFACMRLHASMYMLKNQIPGLVLSYASKVKGLFESYNFKNIVDLNSPDYQLKIQSFEFNQEVFEPNISKNPWELLK